MIYKLLLMDKGYNWHKIASSVEELNFPSSSIIQQEIAGKKSMCHIIMTSFTRVQPHVPMPGVYWQMGYVDAVGNIVCPVHRYKFSLQHGRNSSGEGYYLKIYKVEKREDGVYIGFQASWLMGS